LTFYNYGFSIITLGNEPGERRKICLRRSTPTETYKEVKKVTAQVGKPAPDFEASAFIDGGFKNIKLSDYKGQWVVVCFYPGDFTFV